MATISQRISLEGSEDIRKQLLALGQAGAQAFKQIQDAAAKPITDPAAVRQTTQALNQLAVATAKLTPQFQALAPAVERTDSSLQRVAADSRLATVGIVALGSALGTGLVAAFGKVKSLVESFSVSELTKGAVETAKQLSDQAGKVKLPVDQWLQLRKAIDATGGSVDDTLNGLTKLGRVIADAQDGLKTLVTVPTAAGDGVATITILNGVIGDTATVSGRAAKALRELGVNTVTLQRGTKLEIMQELAVAIDKIPVAAQRAERGLRVFGDNWEGLIKTLIASKRALEATRDLTPEQVAQLKELGDAWDTLNTSVRAVKDQIGLLFAGPAITQAKWMTSLADGVRKLIVDFSKLSEAKRGAFIEGLGEGAAPTAFKILIAVGQQLAGLWNGVLVPAGQKVAEIVRSIAGSFKGVSGSQVAAFFITAAIAATALAVALKGIGLVLSPIASLISLAFSPLGIILIALGALVALFWAQFVAAAKGALALIPQELQQMKEAFALLFKGDFTGFWNKFSAAAVSAFGKIKDAALKTEIGQGLQKNVDNIIGAFGLLKTAADGTATALNKVFGTQLTGTDVGILAVIGQTTGAFDLLRNAVGITGTAITTFVTTAGGLVTVFGGLPVLLGAVAIGLTGLILYLDPTIWDSWKTAAMNALTAVKGLIAELGFGTVGKDLNPMVWTIFASAALFAINRIVSAIRGLTILINLLIGAIQRVKAAWAGMPSTGPAGGVGGNTGAEPFASGGLIGGRGTGTSDSNLAWVSRGEHIMPARAVQQPGVLAFLEALRRSGGDLSRILDGMGRFALGGMVPRAIPAFANGGPVGSMSNVTIQFPGVPPVSGLRASSEVIDQLHKSAALAQVRSGGRKPSRYS